MSTSEPTVDLHARLERELSLLIRRARRTGKMLAAEVHPDLEPDAYVLLRKIESEERVRVTDMAEYLGVGKPTVSRQLQMLETLGLVARTPNPTDSRSVQLSLTDEGKAVLVKAAEVRVRHVRKMTDSWTDDELDTFATLVGRLNARALASGVGDEASV